MRTPRFSWLLCEQAEERGRPQGELFRGGKGMTYKGQVQQMSLRFSFISTVLSHTASSLDFNKNYRVLEKTNPYSWENAEVHLVSYPWLRNVSHSLLDYSELKFSIHKRVCAVSSFPLVRETPALANWKKADLWTRESHSGCSSRGQLVWPGRKEEGTPRHLQSLPGSEEGTGNHGVQAEGSKEEKTAVSP